MPFVLRRVRRLVADRPRLVAGLVGLLVVGAAFVVASVFAPQGVLRDLLINLGATAVGVVLTAVVLEPLIEVARRPEERILSAFPHQEFISGIAGARRRVRIMSAWPYVMDLPWRDAFLAALREAVRHGTHVQLLVLDPLSPAAEQRRNDLRGTVDVAGVIAETLVALKEFTQTLPPNLGDRFGVRIYSVLPPARLYLFDQRALCSFFSSGNDVGTDARHYDTTVMSGLARFVDEQFDTVWDHPATRTLDRYWLLPVSSEVTRKAAVQAQYVEVEGTVYIASRRLVDLLFRSSATPSVVRLHVTMPDGSTSVHPVDITLRGEDEVALVREAFARKYGSQSELLGGFGAVLKLLPA